MKLSRTISYALQAMLRLAEAEAGVPVPCSQLARDGQMPERFLLQVLRSLVTRGLLYSNRGVVGGYYLARPASQITLRDIVEAFESPLEPRLPEINGSSAKLRERVLGVLRQASNAARYELDKVTLDDLLNAESDGRPKEELSTRRAAKRR